MQIVQYSPYFKQQIIDLILHIQNEEAGIDLSIEEQPDLLDIEKYYYGNKGRFWLAVENNTLIGTIALMNKENGNGVLKKFFVHKDFRNQKVGLALYKTLYAYAVSNNYKNIILDTPSVAAASHRFYDRAGFVRIDKTHLPFEYDFPDRHSYLYLLRINYDMHNNAK